jgi:hypothetical protein
MALSRGIMAHRIANPMHVEDLAQAFDQGVRLQTGYSLYNE